MPTRVLVHYGKKGMKWGVITKDKSSGGSDGTKKKPKKLAKPKRTPAQKQAARAEAMRGEAEFLRSIGRSDLAEKLEKDFADSLKEATVEGSPSGAALNEEEAKAKEEEGEEDEEKEGEEEKKGSAGAEKKPKAGAAPAAKKEDKKKTLEESRKKVAEQFREAAADAQEQLNTLMAQKDAFSAKMAAHSNTISAARSRKDWNTVKQLRAEIPKMRDEMSARTKEIEIQTRVVEAFVAKAKDWETMDDKKVKHGHIMHYGVKGMRWGVRKDRVSGGLRKAGSAANAKRQSAAKAMVKNFNNNIQKDADNYRKVGLGKVADKIEKLKINKVSDAFQPVNPAITKGIVSKASTLKGKVQNRINEGIAKRQEKGAAEFKVAAKEHKAMEKQFRKEEKNLRAQADGFRAEGAKFQRMADAAVIGMPDARYQRAAAKTGKSMGKKYDRKADKKKKDADFMKEMGDVFEQLGNEWASNAAETRKKIKHEDSLAGPYLQHSVDDLDAATLLMGRALIEGE